MPITIKTVATAPSETQQREADREHVEELLDEALDESFPASDPPSMTVPKPARE